MPGASHPLRRLGMKAALVGREVRDLGLSTSTAILTSSVRMGARQRRDRRAEGGSSTRRGPGQLLAVEVLPAEGTGTGEEGRIRGARCMFAEAELELWFLADDLVRVSWGPGDPPLPWALAGALANGTVGLADPGPSDPGPSDLHPNRTPWSVPAVTVDVTADTTGPAGTVAGRPTACSVTTAALRVTVAVDGSVRYFGADGSLLRHELPPLRRGASRTVRHVLRPGERVSGLGEQASPMDLRGTVHRLWNRDPGGAWGPGQDPLYCGIPVLVGLHPGGDILAFYDNTYEATVRVDGPATGIGPSPQVEITFGGGRLCHYVAAGPLPRLLDRYTALTGRPPLPPRWALGYHQCKWGYKDEADIREVAAGFRDERIPLSAVHLDIDYMDGYRVFSIDAGRFPDLGRLARELGDRGTRVVTIVDPAVKADPAYDVFSDGVRDGRFLVGEDGEPLIGVVWPGRAAFPDFTDPVTRRWWGSWYRRLLDAGVAGVWHDMNEPTSMTLWGDRTLPRSQPHAAEGRGGDHRECHNVYGLLMDRAGWEALATARPDRRPFVLSRAGWAGLQRWAWNWTGDVESSWDGLRQQVATAVGLGLSGVPYTGSDIGGFSGVPGPELYLRWLELSVLMPFCRTHSVVGSPNREPWRFPEPYRAAIGRLIRFRYRLLPYLYSLADEANRSGRPLVRPLCWPAEEGAASSPDPGLWAVDDAYLLGDALLVAPVTREGASHRPVALPAGRWYRWGAVPALDGAGGESQGALADRVSADRVEVIEGGRTVELEAPAGQPLVLVREGTILPLDDGWAAGEWAAGELGGGEPGDAALASGHEPRRLSWHCFVDTAGSATGAAYDDAGDGTGPSRRDRLRLKADPAGGFVLRWDQQGEHPAPDRVGVVVHGLAARQATADGRGVAMTTAGLPGDVASSRLEVAPFTELRLVP